MEDFALGTIEMLNACAELALPLWVEYTATLQNVDSKVKWDVSTGGGASTLWLKNYLRF